ncbi:hypothetical protein D3C75_1085610 [compost metagenome]
MLHKTGVKGQICPDIRTALCRRNHHTVQLIGLEPDQRMIPDGVGLILCHNFAAAIVNVQQFNTPVRVKPVGFLIFIFIIEHK